MTLDELIDELKRKHDLGACKADSDGVYHFTAGDHHLTLGEGATKEQLFLYSHLSEIPKGGQKTLFRKLLQANLFGVETHGATLSLDKANDKIVLFQAFESKHLTFNRFYSQLETFLATLHRYQGVCAAALSGEIADDEGEEREFDGLKI